MCSRLFFKNIYPSVIMATTAGGAIGGGCASYNDKINEGSVKEKSEHIAIGIILGTIYGGMLGVFSPVVFPVAIVSFTLAKIKEMNRRIDK